MLTRAISGKVGVAILPLSPDMTGWRSDPKEKIIYYPDKPFYDDEDFGLSLHESGHIRFSGLTDISEKELKKLIDKEKRIGLSELWQLLNSVEDIRIEAEVSKLYAGAGYYLKHTNLKYFGLAKYNEQDSPLTRHYCLYFLYKYGLNQSCADEYLTLFDFKKAEKAKLLKAIEGSEEAVSKAYSCKNTDEVLSLVKDELLKWYIPLIDEKDGGTDLKELLEMLNEAIAKLVKLAKEKEKEKSEPKKNKAIKPDPEKAKEIEPQTIKETDGEELRPPKGEADREFMERIRKYTDENLPSIRKAISIIKDKSIIRSGGNYDKGKIVAKRLYKIRTKNYRVFTKPDSFGKDDKNIAFALLIDESGSMTDNEDRNGDNKMRKAILGASLLGEGLRKAGKLYAVFGFQGNFYIHKGFADKHLNAEGYAKIETFAINNEEYEGLNWNSDGYALKRAVEEFGKLPRGYKKVLIVLSDGQPAPHSDFAKYDLKEEAEKAENALSCIFSVGIVNGSVKKFYKNYTIINNPEELPKVIADLFKRVAGKRIR